jgi:hypothetical protein
MAAATLGLLMSEDFTSPIPAPNQTEIGTLTLKVRSEPNSHFKCLQFCPRRRLSDWNHMCGCLKPQCLLTPGGIFLAPRVLDYDRFKRNRLLSLSLCFTA